MASRHTTQARRRLHLAIHSDSYQSVFVCVDDCWYCGDVADTEDHCPPISHAGASKCPHEYRWLIPCCRSCNSLLGSRLHFNPVDRRDAVRALLKRKHARMLEAPEWTADEIDQLDGRLRRTVSSYVQDRKELLDRLSSTALEVAMVRNRFRLVEKDGREYMSYA